jgi:hypothetical protein
LTARQKSRSNAAFGNHNQYVIAKTNSSRRYGISQVWRCLQGSPCRYDTALRHGNSNRGPHPIQDQTATPRLTVTPDDGTKNCVPLRDLPLQETGASVCTTYRDLSGTKALVSADTLTSTPFAEMRIMADQAASWKIPSLKWTRASENRMFDFRLNLWKIFPQVYRGQ